MGADQACLLSDRRFAGADVVATSYTLSQGIRHLGVFDLIICGKQTTDGDTAQVGAEIAEFMDLPHAANVTSIGAIGPDHLLIDVNLEQIVQKQKILLPCLLTVEKDLNMPRLPSYRRMLARRDDQVQVLSLADFTDQDERHYGLAGSPTQVERIFPPVHEHEKHTTSGDADHVAGELLALLLRLKVTPAQTACEIR